MTEPGKEDVIDRRYIRNPEEPVYDVMERRHIDVSGLTDGADLNTVFTTIYRTNRWGSAETRSGTGSERARTRQVALELSRLIAELRIRSVLDIPCGDFNWMQDVSLDGIRYSGYDIVAELISANCVRHGGPGRSFDVLDFTVDPVPSSDLNADLILCRDALVHLSYQHIFAALKHFHDSGSKYLLTTTFLDTKANVDIGPGWWRPVNMQLSPFSLPAPLRILSDKESDDFYADKVLALWDLQALTL
ncbi:MAG TPA: hypothetical protein VGM12_00215 [Trebonia sp.]